MWAMEYMRDEGARKFWDDFSPPFQKDGDGPPHKGQSAATYNRNGDSFALEAVRRWHDYWRERPGTGTRVSSGGVNIIFSDSNTHHRGAENYRRSGEVDAMRIPKDAFFAHQVMWDGWVDVERPRAHIVGHWNYAPGTVKPVHVISSAEQVRLTLNGRDLGPARQRNRFAFTFDAVAFDPGELKAVGYDARGRPVCEAVLRAAGPMAPTWPWCRSKRSKRSMPATGAIRWHSTPCASSWPGRPSGAAGSRRGLATTCWRARCRWKGA